MSDSAPPTTAPPVREDLPDGVVTLVFTDIEGSSRLLEVHPEGYGELLAAHRHVLRSAFAEHGGVEVDTQGDAFLVAFGDPTAAVLAAEQAHTGLAEAPITGPAGLRVRIGVHTGRPELGPEGYWGADVHYGARLGGAARGGQTLLSETTASFLQTLKQSPLPISSLGEHGFKDYPTPRPVFQVGAADAFPPISSLRIARHRLPEATTSFIGRDAEVESLVRLVAGSNHLVTLVGAGGSGKTRLAVETARALTPAFDTICFVPLETIGADEGVLAAVERALGLVESADPARALAEYLSSRSALLLLDNLEHLPGAAEQVALLSHAGPAVRVLATSQAPLKVRSERVVRVAPLSTLADGVRVIRERAEAAGHELSDDATTNRELEQLVEALELMPLALELAGARLGVLGPAQLLRQLDRSLDALGHGLADLPARQRGLRAMLEWTCSLLSESQVDVLAGLAAFAADVDPELLDLALPGAIDELQPVIDAGLVTRSPTGRLDLRPPVRRFVLGLVEPSRLLEHHRAVCSALADVAGEFEPLWLIDNGHARPRIDPEQANLLAALSWAADNDPEAHDELAASVGWWGTHSSVAPTVRSHVDLALARAPAASLLEARLLAARGALGLADADPSWCLRAADAFTRTGHRDREVINLIYAANLARHGRQDAATVVGLAERAVSGARAFPSEPRLEAMAEAILTQSLWYAGEHDSAHLARQRALNILQSADDPWCRAFVVTISADIALAEDQPGEAAALYAECMHLIREFGMNTMEMLQAISMAEAFLAQGRTEDAAYAHAVGSFAHHELGRAGGQFISTYLHDVGERIDPGLRAIAWQQAAADGITHGLARVADIGSR